MDANGLRFWMLAERRDWALADDLADGAAEIDFDDASRRLHLRSAFADFTPTPPLTTVEAETHLNIIPGALDAFGTRAYWDGDAGAVMAVGILEEPTPILIPPAGEVPTDLVMGYDGVLYVALAGDIVLVDRRNRWSPVRLENAAFSARRLAADPDGGVWALDVANRTLARVTGLPLPNHPFRPYSPDTVRPCNEDSDPTRLIILDDVALPTDETLVGLACSPEGSLVLLSWVTATMSDDARVRLYVPDLQRFTPPVTLSGARFPYSAAWVNAHDLAVMLTNVPNEALVYDLRDVTKDQPVAKPNGTFYPLRDHTGGAFLNGVTLPPHYPAEDGSRPLFPLSLPSYARGGTTSILTIDSQNPRTVWHRLYLEAMLPPHCGIRVFLSVTDAPEDPAPLPDSMEWYEHRFGTLFARMDADIPVGAWMPDPSEVPAYPGLLGCEPEKDRAGLFTALVQRAGRRVRTLRGRCLKVRIELVGDGLTTPEIAALRVYESRFSYAQQYLAEVYRETVFEPDADALAPATPHDFLERFLANFEGILTPLEDKIASAYLYTDPQTAPDEALEWLGSWIGLAYDPIYPRQYRRDLLRIAPRLFKLRGTVYGLALALDTATGGAVRGGEIVILENFKLRRTFATILGADLADEDDPLTLGLVNSGNSYVGDTLFLGDESRREFLALFDADLKKTRVEQLAIQRFFDDFAHRATVLVHQEVTPQDLGLIRRIVELETPAHVITSVVTATTPFLVGMASLVGVDTYLGRDVPRRPVQLDRSAIGVRDFLERPPSLDPRLIGMRLIGEDGVTIPIKTLAAVETFAPAPPPAKKSARRRKRGEGNGGG